MKYLLLLAALLAGCSSTQTIVSHQRPADRQFIPEQTVLLQDQKITLGVQNDQEFLYLQVTIPDRRKQRQIAFQGLTVWLDYRGGEERRFGIRYPLPGDHPFSGERPPEMGDTAALTPVTLSDDIEIIGPMAGEHHRVRMSETHGIAVRLYNSDGLMRYLVTVPLSDNGEHIYGIGARPGSTIGLGIESGAFLSGGGIPGGRGGGPRMGGGGIGGGFGRRGGGRPPGEGESRPEPIKFWAKVQLSGV